MTTINGTRKCSQCGSKRTESQFELKKSGEQYKTCIICRNRYKIKKSLKVVVIEQPIVVEQPIITKKIIITEEMKEKCSMCKCLKPLSQFEINAAGKQLKTCVGCRERNKQERNPIEHKEPIAEKTKCSGCKTMRAPSDFNYCGKQVKTCNICRERANKIKMNKKMKEAELINCQCCKMIKLEAIYKNEFIVHNPKPIEINDVPESTDEFDYDNMEIEYFNLTGGIRMPYYNQVITKLTKDNYYEMMRKYTTILNNKSKQSSKPCELCKSEITEAIKNRPAKFGCIKNLTREIVADYKKRVDGIKLRNPMPEPIDDISNDPNYNNFVDEYRQITKTKFAFYNQIDTTITAPEYYKLLKSYSDFIYDNDLF